MKYIWLFVILLCGCAGQSFFNVQADYRNVLNISNWPQGIREGVSLFSDLGAWHGFAFIPDSVGMAGGFSGPMSMASNYAVGSYTAVASVVVDGVLQEVTNAIVEKSYFPGRMIQSFTWETLTLTQEIVFVNNRTSLLRTRVRNKEVPKRLRLFMRGAFLLNISKVRLLTGGRCIWSFPQRNVVLK